MFTLNQDKSDIKRTDLALSAEPRELISVSAADLAAHGAVAELVTAWGC